MADIFVSYCKPDREVVERIVALLEAHGWAVWCDNRIGGGEQWDAVIEREIAIVAVSSFAMKGDEEKARGPAATTTSRSPTAQCSS
jgi:TIR domain